MKTMREADALERADPTLADDIGNSAGALGMENEILMVNWVRYSCKSS